MVVVKVEDEDSYVSLMFVCMFAGFGVCSCCWNMVRKIHHTFRWKQWEIFSANMYASMFQTFHA